MKHIGHLTIALLLSSGAAALAEDSYLVLGKSSYAANCAVCHGESGAGDGEVAGLFKVPPADLSTLSERSGGAFPFSEVYQTIASGMGDRAHGGSKMPIWGDYFVADTLEDRGISKDDAEHIAQGRILSLVYYLESIQK